MKRICLMIGIFAVFLGAATPSFCTQEIRLLAGQDMPVGTVHVWNDASNVYLSFVLDEAVVADGWCITETHVHIGETLGDFPLNKGGNPKVGHFTYSAEHLCVTATEPVVMPYTHNILYNPGFTEGPDGKDGWMAWINLFGNGWFGDFVSLEYATVDDGCVTVQAFPLDIPDEWGFDTAEYNFYSEQGPELPYLGKDIIFSGKIGIETPFGPDTSGSAWIKLFDEWYNMWAFVQVDAATEGPFSIRQNIPEMLTTGYLQIGFLTIGPDPGVGALKACDLRLNVANDWISEMPLIAAHAVIEKTVQVGVDESGNPVYEVMSESAWAEGTRFTEMGNWATWFEYAIDPECWLVMEVDSVNGNPAFGHEFYFLKYGDYLPYGGGYSVYHDWEEFISAIVYDGDAQTLSFTATYPNGYVWYPSFVLNEDGTLTFVDLGGDNVGAATGMWFLNCAD